MWSVKNNGKCYFTLLYISICWICLPTTTCALSDKRLCADPKCEQIISTGTARLSYNGIEEGMVPFKINSIVRILSKSAGKDPRLWGVEVNGRRGYANKDFILEKKIYISEKNLKYELPVTLTDATATVPSQNSNPDVTPTTINQESVLNASEIITNNKADHNEEIVTPISTAPLDTYTLVEKPTIIKETNAVVSTEVPLQSTPVKLELGIGISIDELNNVSTDNADLNVSAAGENNDATENKEQNFAVDSNEIENDNDDDDNDNQIVHEDIAIAIEVPVAENKEFNGEKLLENIENTVNTEEIPATNEAALENDLETKQKIEKNLLQNDQGVEEQAEIIKSLNSKTENQSETETKEIQEFFELPTNNNDKQDKLGQMITTENQKQVVSKIENNSNQEDKIEEEVNTSSDNDNRISHSNGDSSKIVKTAETEQSLYAKSFESATALPKINIEALININESLVENSVPMSTQKTSNTETQTPAEVTEPKVSIQSVHTIENLSNVPSENTEPTIKIKTVKSKIKEVSQQVITEVNFPIEQQQLPVDNKTQENEDIIIVETVPPLSPLFHQHNQKPNVNQQYYHNDDGLLTTTEQTLPAVREITTPNNHETTQYYEQPAALSPEQNIINNNNNNKVETETQMTGSRDNLEVVGLESVETMNTQTNADPIVLSSTSTPSIGMEPIKDNDGLFTTILGTVNSFLSNSEKMKINLREDFTGKNELKHILYPNNKISTNTHEEYCLKPDNQEQKPTTLNNFLEQLAVKILQHSQLLLCLTVAAASSLFFIFSYYCFCNSSNESALLSKLNLLERCLLAAHKENTIIKHDLLQTHSKLSSIEDNSFGSNDMVMSLKKQLEVELLEKIKLQEQVKNLEKDLVSAADAGLELNKYVSELLATQNGDETITATIEELQKQLNEQDQTIRDINASLAEKSRENTELQLTLAQQNARLTSDLSILQQNNDVLESEKANLQTRLEELNTEFEQNLNKTLESKNYEIQRLQNHIMDINLKREHEHSELQTSLAKIEALEDCLKTLKKDTNLNVQEIINTANLRGELNAIQKKYSTLKTHLTKELESKNLNENQIKTLNDEIEQLKKDYNQLEKDKLDAQTRLEVLSTYFKDKESQLQKELSRKEAIWMKQQGEKTATVDKITELQDEIQTLKSQNDELRAEIEAQIASQKAQRGILENRVHEHYLTARQAERRCEEARNEAAILRGHLTAMAAANNVDRASNTGGNEQNIKIDESKDASSPLPPFLPNTLPFLLPPRFMGVPNFRMPPPPPFLPPQKNLRPAPLGRMRSPTALTDRYTPPMDVRRSSRRYHEYDDHDYSDDYDDYDYYDDDYDDRLSPPPPSSRKRHTSHSNSYSPPPRTYRSLSPPESRYNGADTENDYSPPASPRSDTAARPINQV